MRWRESDCRAALLIRNNRCRRNGQKHDPEKPALGLRPDGWVAVFPHDKRENAFARATNENAFARRSCSGKKMERDDDSKKSHPALACAAASLIIAVMSPPEGTGGAGSGEVMLRNSTSHAYPVFTRDRYR